MKSNHPLVLNQCTKFSKKIENGEDYKPLLEEKKKRLEQEKEEKDEQKKENENVENNKGIQYIDDLDDELDDEDPIFKVEKINLRNEKENFLAMLNKPTEEVNKEKINENENDNDNENENNVYKGRFNIEDLDEIDDEKDKEKNNINDNNNIEDINEENEKINDDSTPDLIGNKIYHVDYNKIEEKNKENLDKKEEDKKE